MNLNINKYTINKEWIAVFLDSLVFTVCLMAPDSLRGKSLFRKKDLQFATDKEESSAPIFIEAHLTEI